MVHDLDNRISILRLTAYASQNHLKVYLPVGCCRILNSSNLFAFYFGSHPTDDQTRFTVYATEASSVNVRIYENDGYIDYPMRKVSVNNNYLADNLRENSWEYVHPENLAGRSYYIIQDENHIPFNSLNSRKIEVDRDGVDIFLFNKQQGYLVDTSATGYITTVVDDKETDAAGKLVSKTEYDNRTIFEIDKNEQFDNYFIQISDSGTFPHRIEHYPTADPYCLDLLDNNACVIRKKPGRKIGSIGFKNGHTIHEVHLKDLYIPDRRYSRGNQRRHLQGNRASRNIEDLEEHAGKHLGIPSIA